MLIKESEVVNQDGVSISYASGVGRIVSGNESTSTVAGLDINSGAIYCASNGNVGVNTATPTSQLDIAGGVNVTGNLTVSGTITGSVSGGGTSDHNALTNLQAAGTGVSYGHINATTQSIYGDKSFFGVTGIRTPAGFTYSNYLDELRLDLTASVVTYTGSGVDSNHRVQARMLGNTLASSTPATTTNASTLFLSAPTSSGSMTITNKYALYSTGVIRVSDATQASSSSTGALIVDGGVGVAKNLHVGGNLYSTGDVRTLSSTLSSSSTTGALIVDGGVGIAKNLYLGTSALYNSGSSQQFESVLNVRPATITNNSAAGTDPYHRASVYINGPTFTSANAILTTNASTLYLTPPVASGSMTITNKYSLYSTGMVRVANTTQSTSASTGALVVDGGVGIEKDVYISGNLAVTGTITGTTAGDHNTLSNVQLAGQGVTYGHISDGDQIIYGNKSYSGFAQFIGTSNYGASVPKFYYNGSAWGGTTDNADISVDAIGGVHTSAGFYMTSDRRLKQNIQPLELDIEKYLSLEPVSFDWKRNNSHDIGFIAQDVLACDLNIGKNLVSCIPNDSIEAEEDGKNEGVSLVLKYGNVSIMNHKVIKSQQQHINALEDKVSTLTTALADVLARLNLLEQ